MKELWTTNPFHLVNDPFAEMGYSSSEPNIVPAHLLLAIRTPLAAPPRAASASPLRATRRPPPTHHPLASGAASADANRYPHPLVRTSRRHYGRRFAGIGAPYPLLTIRLLPAQHPSAPCMPSARRLSTNHLPTHGAASAVSLQHTARHLAAPCKPSANAPVHHHPLVPCTASAISPQTIHHRAAHHPLAPCATSIGPLHIIRHRTAQHPAGPARHPLTPCRQSAGTNRCP